MSKGTSCVVHLYVRYDMQAVGLSTCVEVKKDAPEKLSKGQKKRGRCQDTGWRMRLHSGRHRPLCMEQATPVHEAHANTGMVRYPVNLSCV